MAFGLRWSGTGVFLATEIRVQFHEWLAIVTGTLTPGALLIFVAILAPDLIAVTLIGSLVYSVVWIGQRVLNEAAYIRIDHKLNELYHASPLSPEAYFVGIAGGMLVAYLPPSLFVLAILEILHPLSIVAWLVLAACLLAVWAVSSTIGYVVSTLFKDMKTIWPYSALLTNLFGIVPPVFYPIRFVPTEWRWIWRSPAAAIVPLLQPFFFLYFLHLISDPSYFPLQVAGAMIFSTQNIGSWCLSDSAVFRIELRLQDIFVASPHDKLRYLIGVAFSNIIPALPALMALGIILATVTSVSLTAWLVIVACILIIWVLYSAIGIAVSSRLRSQREVWPVGNLIFTLLGILSPLYYPLSRLPPVWRELAQLLPATYPALLVQGTLGLEPAPAASLAVDARPLIPSAAIRLAPAWWVVPGGARGRFGGDAATGA